MATAQDTVLADIHHYAAKARDAQEGAMDFDASRTQDRLANTVRELQDQVDRQKAALETLRASASVDLRSAAYASADLRKRLRQLQAVKAAYARPNPTPQFLPNNESAFPALLAARAMQQNIRGTKETIASTEEQITQTEARLRREEDNLSDANLMAVALKQRIENLRTHHEERSQKGPVQLAKELIATKREQKDAYDAKAKQLSDDFHVFVTEILAPMLAAEELGGPVVGDLPDVEDDTLAVGFTKTGKARATKKVPSERPRQRRIDQIWGKQVVLEDEHLSEAEAADNEMRKLIENLFATLIGPGNGKAYYELDRDSAASRFLVRAKIAQFHPRDARKLRLIDFGRELDD